MFAALATVVARVTPLAKAVAPHVVPVGIVAVREFAIGISIGAGIRTAGDGIVRSMAHDIQRKPFLDPTHTMSENVGELTGTIVGNAVKETRTYGPFWAGMALSTALLPVAPTAAAWMWAGGISWLMKPVFKQIVTGFREGWTASAARKAAGEKKDPRVSRRQRRAASKVWDQPWEQKTTPVATGSTVMGAVPAHVQDGTPDPQIEQIRIDLDMAEIERNPFSAGVSVAFRTANDHPERINAAREALLDAMRLSNMIDAHAKQMLSGFNAQAKLIRRAA